MDIAAVERACAAFSRLRTVHPLGRVTEARGGMIEVSGLGAAARLGDGVRVGRRSHPLGGEIIRIAADRVHVLLEGNEEGLILGDPVVVKPQRPFAPDKSWIGRVVDPDGQPLDGRPLLPGLAEREIRARPPLAQDRKPWGRRLNTGIAALDTLLPLVQGQRLGLFAGSGVGKSTLLGDLAKGVDADVIVIGLVGERGRELRHFVQTVLGPEGLSRAVVVAATSDRAPQVRRRCAWAATAIAEYFRDQGQQVLLLLDSVTRFAEAHRELAAMAGEPAALRGFPATTGPAIAALTERAGTGVAGAGDITTIYTVLVAGSDMDEPLADMLRGLLDGHIVLDRAIAERGRFPAIDLLRSVSRSLPQAASEGENALIARARRMIGKYQGAEMMVQAGLYVAGSDEDTDAAIACHAPLEAFLAKQDTGGVEDAFLQLRHALNLS